MAIKTVEAVEAVNTIDEMKNVDVDDIVENMPGATVELLTERDVNGTTKQDPDVNDIEVLLDRTVKVVETAHGMQQVGVDAWLTQQDYLSELYCPIVI